MIIIIIIIIIHTLDKGPYVNGKHKIYKWTSLYQAIVYPQVLEFNIEFKKLLRDNIL